MSTTYIFTYVAAMPPLLWQSLAPPLLPRAWQHDDQKVHRSAFERLAVDRSAVARSAVVRSAVERSAVVRSKRF